MKKKEKYQRANRSGQWAEKIAALLLILRGFTIIARNYRPNHRRTPLGEIDIIAKKQNLFIFVEVKFRNKRQDGLDNIISENQQQRITNSARIFMSQKKYALMDFDARFDVILFQRWHKPIYIANAWLDS